MNLSRIKEPHYIKNHKKYMNPVYLRHLENTNIISTIGAVAGNSFFWYYTPSRSPELL